MKLYRFCSGRNPPGWLSRLELGKNLTREGRNQVKETVVLNSDDGPSVCIEWSTAAKGYQVRLLLHALGLNDHNVVWGRSTSGRPLTRLDEYNFVWLGLDEHKFGRRRLSLGLDKNTIGRGNSLRVTVIDGMMTLRWELVGRVGGRHR